MGGKTSYESIKKYQDKVYDRIGVIVPKGMKAEIKKIADSKKMSLNAFVVEAVREKMEREKDGAK